MPVPETTARVPPGEGSSSRLGQARPMSRASRPTATAISTGDRGPVSETTASSSARAAPRGARSGTVTGPPSLSFLVSGRTGEGSPPGATVAVYECPLVTAYSCSSFGAAACAAVRTLLATGTEHDGVSPLDEAALLALDGEDARHLLLTADGAATDTHAAEAAAGSAASADPADPADPAAPADPADPADE